MLHGCQGEREWREMLGGGRLRKIMGGVLQSMSHMMLVSDVARGSSSKVSDVFVQL